MKDELGTYDYTRASDSLPIPQIDRDFAVLHMSTLYWSCSILLYTTIHMVATESGQNSFVTCLVTIP